MKKNLFSKIAVLSVTAGIISSPVWSQSEKSRLDQEIAQERALENLFSVMFQDSESDKTNYTESEYYNLELDDSSPETEITSIIPENIVISRSVVMPSGQYLDVIYPGRGWTYLGEVDKNNVIGFFGRRLTSENTMFTLRSKKAGKVILHFYKNDYLTGNFIDDFLEVTVTNEKGNLSSHTKAPSYAEIVPPKPDLTRNLDEVYSEKSEQLQNSDSKSENVVQTEKTETTETVTTTTTTNTTTQSENSLAQTQSSASESTENTASQEASPVQNTNSNATMVTTRDDLDDILSGNNSSNTQVLAASEDNGRTNIQTMNLQGPAAEQNVISATENKSSSTESTTTTSTTTTVTTTSVKTQSSSAKKSSEVQKELTLLELAQKAYENQDYAKALSYVNDYLEISDSDTDKALFLRGRILEARSDEQDILDAISSYSLVLKDYPLSTVWNDAYRHSVYLQRFYLNKR